MNTTIAIVNTIICIVNIGVFISVWKETHPKKRTRAIPRGTTEEKKPRVPKKEKWAVLAPGPALPMDEEVSDVIPGA